MKKYTEQEFRAAICKKIMEGEADVQTDTAGQLVIYTNFFENASDHVIQDAPDPEWDLK